MGLVTVLCTARNWGQEGRNTDTAVIPTASLCYKAVLEIEWLSPYCD